METSNVTILRFKRSERLLHWAIALPFLGCLSTAMFLLLLSEGDSSGLIRGLISTTHKTFGMSLIICPLIVLISHWSDLFLHLKNIKEGWMWSLDDIKWIMLMPLSILSKKISLPMEGKFNAGEKINIMMTMTGYFCFAMTGLFILYERDVFLSSSIHFFITTLSVPVIAGHIFMATINPQTRKGLTGMITGFVDREWASHHYRRWFSEEFNSEAGKREISTAETVTPEHGPDGRNVHSVTGTVINLLSTVFVGTVFALLLYSSTVVYVRWLAPYVTG